MHFVTKIEMQFGYVVFNCYSDVLKTDMWRQVEHSEAQLWSLLGQQQPGTISPELRARIEGALAVQNK